MVRSEEFYEGDRESVYSTAGVGEKQCFANLAMLPADDPVHLAHERYGLNEATSERRWEEFYPRFDLAQEPNEPFRFGWSVEFDAYDPTSTPKKRTALGRNKHEGATSVVVIQATNTTARVGRPM